MTRRVHSSGAAAEAPNTSGHLLGKTVFALAIAALVVAIYAQELPNRTIQARMNARFVDATSLADALATYRPVRPPLFAITTRALTQLGIPVEAVNLLFFGGLLAWAWWFVGRLAPQVNPAIPVALLALAHFNYPTLATLTSEILLTLLAALWLSALAAHLRSPGLWSHLYLSVLTAAACATRYIALFWLLPIVCVHLLARRGASTRRRLSEAATLAAIALTPAAVWMLHAYATTGYLSGRDRFSVREVVYRSDLAGIQNAILTASQYVKTVFIDFFSVRTSATHQVVNLPYPPNLFEFFVAGLAVVTVVCAVGLLVQRSERQPGRIRTRAAELLSSPSETTLLVEIVVVFAAATLLLWVIGNNDRLYTRFLYPSYPFMVLLGFAVYSKICRAGAGLVLRLPFSLLYVLLLGVQLLRDARILRGDG